MARSRSPSASTGTLRIGDQWNAITIIAHSQTHPLKAICELTENAIDAGGRRIRIIRRRQRGSVFLEVEDDGRGVAPDDHGDPDFERIATHLCDSMKRHLDPRGRKGVHGEFGIGLLSFWALGEELRMISAASGGKPGELHLVRGERQYAIRPVRGRIVAEGTRIVVGPLLESTRKLVTGEKIARYLSAELRDRIRATGARIHVADRVARREITVTPREFTGERLDLPRRYPTPLGDVQVEIYVRAEGEAGDGGVGLCKDGTRVLKEITELLPFQHAPWTDRRLEGLVDFEPLTLAPGTRSGVVPDAAFEALVAAAAAIEADLAAALAAREQAETERASRQLLKQVHKAFASALAELPAEEYVYFDIPKPGGDGTGMPGEPLATDGAKAPGDAGREPADQPLLFPPEPGPLHAVRITPRHPRRPPGGTARLTARASDAAGVPITAGVSYAWQLGSGEAALTADGPTCTVTQSEAGVATVTVTAVQGDTTVTDQVEVRFAEGAGDDDGPSQRGLPSYRLEAEHGQPWRSRYDQRHNEIVINSAHRDFLASRVSPAKHRRYIGKLYAKEVVLSNFPHESPAQALERLVEITLRTEDSL
jgi:hypothetical protein